jgi:hypothetical protein
MIPQVQHLQLLQCADGLQAAEAEGGWVVCFNFPKACNVQG